MKIKLKTALLAAIAVVSSGNIQAQILVTDSVSIAQQAISHAAEYAQMAAQYAKQIEEYQTQLQQYDLEKIAGKTIDTSGFGDSLKPLEQYKSAYNMDASAKGIADMETSSSILGKMGGSADSANREYLNRLDAATNSEYELTKQSSALAQARMDSVEADKTMMTNLQNANGQAEGQMQAAQIGNQINSETLGQLVKMREEAAMTAQMQADQRRIELEEEAARKAAWDAQKARMDSTSSETPGKDYGKATE